MIWTLLSFAVTLALIVYLVRPVIHFRSQGTSDAHVREQRSRLELDKALGEISEEETREQSAWLSVKENKES